MRDLIGKVRCEIKYNPEGTNEQADIGQSTEVLYQRQIDIDRKIPRFNDL